MRCWLGSELQDARIEVEPEADNSEVSMNNACKAWEGGGSIKVSLRPMKSQGLGSTSLTPYLRCVKVPR